MLKRVAVLQVDRLTSYPHIEKNPKLKETVKLAKCIQPLFTSGAQSILRSMTATRSSSKQKFEFCAIIKTAMPRNTALLHIVASMGELCFKAWFKNNNDWHLACAAIELQRVWGYGRGNFQQHESQSAHVPWPNCNLQRDSQAILLMKISHDIYH